MAGKIANKIFPAVDFTLHLWYNKVNEIYPEVTFVELGAKIKQARQAAGLSQRQLCGAEITRNMLSQIENGWARPSMKTLQYLAGRLGHSVDWFLQEEGSPLEAAREALARGEFAPALALRETGPEASLLRCLGALGEAEAAILQGRLPYARQLLADMAPCVYMTAPLVRQKNLLLAKIQPERAAALLAEFDDEELLLRAKVALEQGDGARCGALLDSAKGRGQAWCILRGDAYFAQGAYRQAMELYRPWEKDCRKKLEQCCLALEDYKGAYYYATLSERGSPTG